MASRNATVALMSTCMTSVTRGMVFQLWSMRSATPPYTTQRNGAGHAQPCSASSAPQQAVLRRRGRERLQRLLASVPGQPGGFRNAQHIFFGNPSPWASPAQRPDQCQTLRRACERWARFLPAPLCRGRGCGRRSRSHRSGCRQRCCGAASSPRSCCISASLSASPGVPRRASVAQWGAPRRA